MTVVRVVARALGVAAAAAGVAGVVVPAGAAPTQTLGMNYSGYGCPFTPTYARPGAATTLVISTATNFTSGATFVVPSMNIRSPLPMTLSTAVTYVDLGVPASGNVAYRIDSTPTAGSSGVSCQGTIAVGATWPGVPAGPPTPTGSSGPW
jgi:hypothetical protein